MHRIRRNRTNARDRAASHLKGMTLIELLILLAFLVIVLLIAVPTLKSPKITDVEQFARNQLKYLYERERAYFLRNGHYESFAELAKPENGGPFLDRRFEGVDRISDRGVTFIGPAGKTDKLKITAKLPGGLMELVVDSSGQITAIRSKAKEEKQKSPYDIEIPNIELPHPEDVGVKPGDISTT